MPLLKPSLKEAHKVDQITQPAIVQFQILY
jgi:hypothetical protein